MSADEPVALHYEPGAGTTPSRHPERARYDADTVHAILDEAILAHVAFVVDGRPAVLPMLFVRDGGSLYLHGSTGARPARMAARNKGKRLEVVIEATLVDELVLARSAFSHSANYRSVVAHGAVVLVNEEAEKQRAMLMLTDKIVPGRASDAREASPDELRQTAVLRLDLDEVSAKVRTGDPIDDEADLSSRVWAGVWPLVTTRGLPRAAADLAADIALPSYLSAEAADAQAPGIA